MTLPIHEGFADFRGWRTWYRITGDLQSGPPPLVVLHGGPGMAHDYLLRLTALAETGRAVIHYDQLGCGRSTHLPEKGPEFWQVPLLVDELTNLLAHLDLARGYHVLGQSWGGMLAAEHAVLRPPGLRSVVIADSPASMALWLQEAGKLRALLPPDVQATLLQHETDGTTDSAAYQDAVRVFYDRHVCRIPWPPELEATFAQMLADPTVYFTMNGPSEFHCIGTIKDWSIIDRLDQIAVPTLLISGRHDEATPAVVQPFADRVPDVRWRIFEESSHLPHIEETEAFLAEVRAFFETVESTADAGATAAH
jgi:L-proline amide hydrolase